MRFIFPVSFFLLIVFSFLSCKSNQTLNNSQKYENSLRQQIAFHVKSWNEGNIAGLEKVYAENYEGLSPISKFENKQELINKIVESQKKQQLYIEYEIFELSATASMAYALLNWRAISNFGQQNQDQLYSKKHLQIWIKTGKEWQLKRSLFYN